jgi:outer membrane murein-binding lipoprotein Lpp
MENMFRATTTLKRIAVIIGAIVIATVTAAMGIGKVKESTLASAGRTDNAPVIILDAGHGAYALSIVANRK